MEFNTYEYGIDKKFDGPLKKKADLLKIGYVLFTILLCGILFAIKFFWGIAIVPLVLYIVIICTWRFVQIDYRYSIETGKFTLRRKYGKNKGRPQVVAEFRVKSAALIKPLADSAAEIANFAPTVVIDATPSADDPDLYCILYTDDNGQKCQINIQVTQQGLKLLRYYNENTVMSNPVTP